MPRTTSLLATPGTWLWHLAVNQAGSFFLPTQLTLTTTIDGAVREFATLECLYPKGQDVFFVPMFDDTAFRLLAVPY